MEQKYKTCFAVLVIIFSLGLVVHANVQDSLEKRRQVKFKIGTGICNESDYTALEEDLTRCSKKSETFQIQLDSRNSYLYASLCSYLNGAMMCFDPFEKCYSARNLKKLKKANLEGTVELVAEVGNGNMADMMRDCNIYKQIVGDDGLTAFDIFHMFLVVLIIIAIAYVWTIKKSHPEC